MSRLALLSRLALASLALLLPSCGESSTLATDDGGNTGGGPAPDALRLAVIPKGTTHEFWNAVRRGADQAGAELEVQIDWKGPIKESDRASQIEIVQQYVAQDVDGIALAPLDDKALKRSVQRAVEAGIPVVIFDSGLDGTPGEDFASFVATDNLAGGRLAGETLADLLDGTGKVLMLRYQEGSASTAQREAGFLEAIAGHAGIEMVDSSQFGGASIDSAKTKALNMVDQLRAVDGIFCPNESVTVGMLLALRQENLLDAVKFVGFDSSTKLASALEAGEIDALVLQDPVDMGARAVRTLVQAIRGETVPPRIDTALAVATPANAADPDIARLLR